MAVGDMSAPLLWKSGQILVGMSSAYAKPFQFSRAARWVNEQWRRRYHLPTPARNSVASLFLKGEKSWPFVRGKKGLGNFQSHSFLSWRSVVNNILSITHLKAAQTQICCSLPSWRNCKACWYIRTGRKERSLDGGSAIHCKWWQKSSPSEFKHKLFSCCNYFHIPPRFVSSVKKPYKQTNSKIIKHFTVLAS